MLRHFSLRHIPALGVAVLHLIGGAVTLFNPRRAVMGFGLPMRVAESAGAPPLMGIFGARATVIGVLIVIFYARDQLAAVDTTLAVLGVWAGIVDFYALFLHGDPAKALLRLLGSWVVGIYGLVGLTQGR